MNRIIERNEWAAFVREFSKTNFLRTTRLEVLDKSGAQMEERGLPFAGLDLELKGGDAPRVEILLGGEGLHDRRLSHTIPQVIAITVKVGSDGRDEVLKIESGNNTSTLVSLGDLPGIAP